MTDWRTLVGCCSQLMRYAIRLTRNRTDAEDLVQDTLERAWTKREQCHGEPLAWMHAIMRNVFWDQRSRYPRERVLMLGELVREPAIASSAEPYCVLADVSVAMNRMSPKLAEVFTLNRIEGLEYADIARRLKIPIGTVKSLIHDATNELRAATGVEKATSRRVGRHGVSWCPKCDAVKAVYLFDGAYCRACN